MKKTTVRAHSRSTKGKANVSVKMHARKGKSKKSLQGSGVPAMKKVGQSAEELLETGVISEKEFSLIEEGKAFFNPKLQRVVKKHQRVMKKRIEEDILTKDSRGKKSCKSKDKKSSEDMVSKMARVRSFRKDARTVKGKDGKWKADGHHTENMAGRGKGRNIHQKINDRVNEMDEMSMGRKFNNQKRKEGKTRNYLSDFNGKAHSQSNDLLQGSRRAWSKRNKKK